MNKRRRIKDLEEIITSDITEKRKLEKELEAARAELKKENDLNKIFRAVLTNPPKYSPDTMLGKYMIKKVELQEGVLLKPILFKYPKLFASAFYIVWKGIPLFNKDEIAAEMDENSKPKYIYTICDKEICAEFTMPEEKLVKYEKKLNPTEPTCADDAKTRFLVVYNKNDIKVEYMETAWTDKELSSKWDVISEHASKEEAKIAVEKHK